MKPEYADWVKANVPTHCAGLCADVTKTMQETFPELQRVRGHYYCVCWGERSHWWLKTPSNEIVDPTAAQFPSKGNGEYVEWVEGEQEPTGRCLNCGELCYGEIGCSNICSDLCDVEFRASLM